MSFSTETKNELARVIPERRCCQVAELAAIVLLEGHWNGDNRARSLTVATAIPAVARKVYLLLKRLFDPPISIAVTRRRGFHGRQKSYSVRVEHHPGLATIMQTLGVEPGGTAAPALEKRFCCCRSYVRGAVLSRGSITAPEKTYHFEIVVDHESIGQSLVDCMNREQDLTAKMSVRKNGFVVYLKGGEQIVDVLSSIGAHSALLNLENVRVVKGMKNRVNRLVNCETANVDKTVKAAMDQIEHIHIIDQAIGIDDLSPKLREVAKLRLQFPYATLKELGEYMDPPVSKSGIQYRIGKLKRMAEDLA